MARKAWLKNGKVIMRDGKVVMCEDCPCEENEPCRACANCKSGTTPSWIRLAISGIADGSGFKNPRDCPCDTLNGEYVLIRQEPTITNPCLYLCRSVSTTNQLCTTCGDSSEDPPDDRGNNADVSISPGSGYLTATVQSTGVETHWFYGNFPVVDGEMDCSDILGVLTMGGGVPSYCDWSGAVVEIVQVGPPCKLSLP